MNTLTRHQIIENNGQPLFVLVPYAEYMASLRPESAEAVIPLAVSKAANMEGKSLVRAWREYKGLSQADMAERMGISRPAYAQLETKGANTRATTLHRLAAALEVPWEQLCDDEE
ncbi:MAG: helix-turn-helix domain-containing protein [Desulfovibrio sp.]|jgi:DNA-binding XRE family transcriptional regulator|nr:helix-turn-helix domain-containing protein [Desulfovibrio sp.]